jgi:hypothetical protein
VRELAVLGRVVRRRLHLQRDLPLDIDLALVRAGAMRHLVRSLRAGVVVVAGVHGLRAHDLLGDVREVIMPFLLAGLSKLLNVALLRWRLLATLGLHLVQELLT